MKDRFRSTGGLRSQASQAWMGTVRVPRGGVSAASASVRASGRGGGRGGQGSQGSRRTTHVRDGLA